MNGEVFWTGRWFVEPNELISEANERELLISELVQVKKKFMKATVPVVILGYLLITILI